MRYTNYLTYGLIGVIFFVLSRVLWDLPLLNGILAPFSIIPIYLNNLFEIKECIFLNFSCFYGAHEVNLILNAILFIIVYVGILSFLTSKRKYFRLASIYLISFFYLVFIIIFAKEIVHQISFSNDTKLWVNSSLEGLGITYVLMFIILIVLWKKEGQIFYNKIIKSTMRFLFFITELLLSLIVYIAVEKKIKADTLFGRLKGIYIIVLIALFLYIILEHAKEALLKLLDEKFPNS